MYTEKLWKHSKWSLRIQLHNYEGSDVLCKREASRGAEHNDQRTEKLNDQKAASSYLIRERTVNMSRLSATAVLVFALISISAAGPTEQQYRSRKYTQSRDMLIIVVLCFVYTIQAKSIGTSCVTANFQKCNISSTCR